MSLLSRERTNRQTYHWPTHLPIHWLLWNFQDIDFCNIMAYISEKVDDYDSDRKETGPSLQKPKNDNTCLRKFRDLYRTKYKKTLAANAEL